MSAWQPIETAPKDATDVLLFIPIEDAGFTAIGFFDDDPEFKVQRWIALGSVVQNPTHWMPLPAPPASGTFPSGASGSPSRSEARPDEKNQTGDLS